MNEELQELIRSLLAGELLGNSYKDFVKFDYEAYDTCFNNIFSENVNSSGKVELLRVMGKLIIQACPERRKDFYATVKSLLSNVDAALKSQACISFIGLLELKTKYPEVYDFETCSTEEAVSLLDTAISLGGVEKQAYDLICDFKAV